jgi:hypothetical protein
MNPKARKQVAIAGSMCVFLLCVTTLALWGKFANRSSLPLLDRRNSTWTKAWIEEQKEGLLAGKSSEVHFYCTTDTNSLLVVISGMPQVKKLTFQLTDLSSDAMQLLASFSMLEELTIYGKDPIGALGELRSCANLTTFRIIGCGVIDTEIRDLPTLSSLQILTMFPEGLTENAVQSLEKCQSLRRLIIREGIVNTQQKLKLERSLPNCQITESSDFPDNEW